MGEPLPTLDLVAVSRACAVQTGDLRSASDDRRDAEAAERDRRADQRDHDAEERDRLSDERDHEAEVAERQVSAGTTDLSERRSLSLLRHQAAAERQQSALDRGAAAADRKQAARERGVAARERGDADEEREILQRDELTGVLQRGAGLIALEREVARSTRSGDPFVVAFIDVDGLKQVNDELGHGSGDEVLRILGETLRSGMRSYDLALRYGGDEFVCILPGFGVAEAEARFHVLQDKLASGPVPVSVTFGVAEWRPGEDTEVLLARADAALYAVRRTVRGEASDALESDEASAVTAHGLLNSAAVVSMGITTLQTHWNGISGPERMHLLQRMLAHASFLDDRLKGLTQGRLSLGASPSVSDQGGAGCSAGPDRLS
jgi:diguanylate cyclase (GGDEF)-like protein